MFQDSGLLSVITDPIHTPVTLFWPSDQALQALPREQQDFLFNQDNKDKLKEYLKFHVIRDAKVFCFHTDRNGKFALEVIKSRNCLYLSVSMVLGGLSIPCPCCVLL